MVEEKMAKPAPAASSDDNIFGALCYIIGVIVPLFVLFTEKKSNKFLAFHAWQSLMLSIAFFVIFVALGVMTMFLAFVPGVNIIVGLVSMCGFPLIGLAVLIFMLFLAYKAYQGEKFMVPTVGEMAQKQVMK